MNHRAVANDREDHSRYPVGVKHLVHVGVDCGALAVFEDGHVLRKDRPHRRPGSNEEENEDDQRKERGATHSLQHTSRAGGVQPDYTLTISAR